jgi:hypothetical protein
MRSGTNPGLHFFRCCGDGTENDQDQFSIRGTWTKTKSNLVLGELVDARFILLQF